jgi:hypothetical protein
MMKQLVLHAGDITTEDDLVRKMMHLVKVSDTQLIDNGNQQTDGSAVIVTRAIHAGATCPHPLLKQLTPTLDSVKGCEFMTCIWYACLTDDSVIMKKLMENLSTSVISNEHSLIVGRGCKFQGVIEPWLKDKQSAIPHKAHTNNERTWQCQERP